MDVFGRAVALRLRNAMANRDAEIEAEAIRLVVDRYRRIPFSVAVGGDEQLARHQVRHAQPEHEQGLRFGIVREVVEKLEGEVRGNFDEAVRALREAGAIVEQASIPTIGYAIAIYYIVANAEASANLARFDGVRYGHRSRRGATVHDMYFDTRGEGFGPEVKRRIMLGTFALSSGYHQAYYGRAQAVRARMRADFDAAFRSFDFLLTPTTPEAAFKIGPTPPKPPPKSPSDPFPAPADPTGTFGLHSGIDDFYISYLVSQSLAAARRAVDVLTPARLRVGELHPPDVQARLSTTFLTTDANPDVKSGATANGTAESTDTKALVLQLVNTQTGANIETLFNWAAHNQQTGHASDDSVAPDPHAGNIRKPINQAFSHDWPVMFASAVEAGLGG